MTLTGPHSLLNPTGHLWGVMYCALTATKHTHRLSSSLMTWSRSGRRSFLDEIHTAWMSVSACWWLWFLLLPVVLFWTKSLFENERYSITRNTAPGRVDQIVYQPVRTTGPFIKKAKWPTITTIMHKHTDRIQTTTRTTETSVSSSDRVTIQKRFRSEANRRLRYFAGCSSSVSPQLHLWAMCSVSAGSAGGGGKKM